MPDGTTTVGTASVAQVGEVALVEVADARAGAGLTRVVAMATLLTQARKASSLSG